MNYPLEIMHGCSRVIPGVLLAFLVGGAPSVSAQAPELDISFGWVLSDFTGVVPFGEVGVAIDPSSGEVLVGSSREVHVFNEVGMEVYRLRTDRRMANVLDLAVQENGSVVTLARDLEAPATSPRIAISRYDFRGKPMGQIEISGAPPPFDEMLPNRVFSRGNGLVLASTMQMLAMLVGADGTFERGYDLAGLLEIPEDERDSHELGGLSVDDDGNLLFTCAVLFSAFVVSPEGQLVQRFGQSGSIPGTFGIVAGIARDQFGRTYVADKARKVVIIFDDHYQLITEIFGDMGRGGPRLGIPSGVKVDRNGNLYVTQVGRRGVWVYRTGSK